MVLSRRQTLGLAVVAFVAAFGSACNLTRSRLVAEWESEPLPKRTLVLRRDGTYLQRFSGKTLGFLSEVVGPEMGTWTVEEKTLVLVGKVKDGDLVTRRLAIDNLESSGVTLDGERWRRVR
jgi:hypothetical protein